MTDAGLRQLSRQAAEQSIEVIRRRIDPNGTSEVSIVRQGDNRIVVQARAEHFDESFLHPVAHLDTSIGPLLP